ncbi:---NA--- [Paramuricea clavata]|uniref:---NA n=1 Tax=Paramuricea clavata TaxID=317549 RepID=A0A6S7HZZ3_PARCT|nr:---NA--- [Paramuricea clavata]
MAGGTNNGVQYLGSVPGVLKILEIILQIVCVGFVGYFWDNWVWKDYDDVPKNDYIKIFLWSTAASGIITLLFFLIFLIGSLMKKIAAAIFILLAILLFAVSGLLVDTLVYYKDKDVCKALEFFDADSQCKQLTAGIILLLICVGSVGYFWDNCPWKDLDDYPKNDYIKFFLAATVVAWIIALLFFLIFVAGVHKKIDVFNWAMTAALIFILLAILVIVASGLLADTVKYYKDNGVCKALEFFEKDSRCKQLTAGTVCGFFAGVILLVDGIVHFKL